MSSVHAKVTSKGQITIPQEVRQEMGVRAGDRVLFFIEGDGSVVIRKVPAKSLDDLVGLLGQPRRKMSIHQMDEAIRRRVSPR